MARRIASDAPEAIATAKFIRISPTKARQVVDLIRGRAIDDARRVLAFTPRAASTPVAKALNSAVANAEHNRALTADELVVLRTWVDEGPTLRRFRPRALGRATRIRKRTCHISVVVGRREDEPVAPPGRKKTTSRRSTAKKTTARKSSTKKAAAKKTTAKKTTAKKTTAKKTTGKKTTATKTTKKTTARKSTAKKTTRRKNEGEAE
jgi:large subunit ribosomal protein L22